MGTTIAELGNRNRPLDMIVYQKNGQEFLLMSNNSRGVMKIPTANFGDAAGITTPVTTEKGGIGYESIASHEGRGAARPARRQQHHHPRADGCRRSEPGSSVALRRKSRCDAES